MKCVPCRERVRLVCEYNAIVGIYSALVTELKEMVELGLESEIDLVHRGCKTALDNAQRAREQLLRHEAEHNCAVSLAKAI